MGVSCDGFIKEVLVRRLFWALALWAVCAQAQSNPAAQAARRWREQHERAIVDEFVGLLSIPNIAADKDNIQRNAQTIAQMMLRSVEWRQSS